MGEEILSYSLPPIYPCSFEVRSTISVTREECSDAVPEVGGDRISNELPVMGRDVKGLRFRRVSSEAKGSLYSPKGVVKQACAREPKAALSRWVKAVRRDCGNARRGSLSESVVREIRPLRCARGNTNDQPMEVRKRE